MSGLRRAVRPAGPPTLLCPTCGGGGEVGTRQDYWGNWETDLCRTCRGDGVLAADHALHLLDELDPPPVRRTAPALTAADDPWALPPGWPADARDVEPPF